MRDFYKYYIFRILSTNQYRAIAIMIPESTLMSVGYQDLFLKKYTIGNAKATIMSCPHSIPRLNARSDDMNLSSGTCISLKSHANPSPWNNPKKNIAPIFDLVFPKNKLPRRKTDVKAT